MTKKTKGGDGTQEVTNISSLKQSWKRIGSEISNQIKSVPPLGRAVVLLALVLMIIVFSYEKRIKRTKNVVLIPHHYSQTMRPHESRARRQNQFWSQRQRQFDELDQVFKQRRQALQKQLNNLEKEFDGQVYNQQYSSTIVNNDQEQRLSYRYDGSTLKGSLTASSELLDKQAQKFDEQDISYSIDGDTMVFSGEVDKAIIKDLFKVSEN